MRFKNLKIGGKKYRESGQICSLVICKIYIKKGLSDIYVTKTSETDYASDKRYIKIKWYEICSPKRNQNQMLNTNSTRRY